MDEGFKKNERLIKNLEIKIDQCIANYDSLNKKVDDLSAEVLVIKNANLTARIDELEKKCGDMSTPSSAMSGLSIEETFAEFDDRRRRASNVLIYDFPESTAPRSIDAQGDDLKNLEESLNKLSPDFVDSLRRTTRIGLPRPNVCRPLKVVLDSSITATKLLIANRASNPSVFSSMSSDKTQMQRDYLKKLRSELKTKIENGEPSTIKYKSGVPTIVSLDDTMRHPRSSKN
ncbi:hypothetical protein GE061_020312 [Apolygus lucorum]|uniref:Uncharacterized protein n=1 Tax=Apolygus lucorum TaxID=248454 RepID=A0A8S9WIT3_APOLU|nr:hypothetical protein GE061_020312 [Apolygus lucorum]